MTARETAALHRLLLAAPAAGDALTDRDLLRRFAAGDQDAFAVLVRRHAGLVLGVCRRALPTLQDAEDACQATFLILARKAGSGSWQASVANWLYATARKVAGNARVVARRRAQREKRAAVSHPAFPLDHMSGRELLAALDEELARLPAHYREPLVLCYLEGLTRDQAAARLRLPAATLKSQLERGRKQLAAALRQRGLALGAGLLAVATTSPAEASPPRLIEALLAAVRGRPSATAATLAREVTVNGVMGRIVVAAVAVAGAVLLWGAGGLGATGPQPPAQGRQANPAAAQPPAAAEGITYRGLVLGPDRRPVAEAKLYQGVAGGDPQRPMTVAEAATTGADGRFEFRAPPGPFATWPTVVTALAPGLGAGWAVAPPGGPKEDLTIQLAEDQPVTGQIVDLEGQPVAGATVRVLQIRAPLGEDFGAWLEAATAGDGPAQRLEHTLLPRSTTAVAASAVTDAGGRFRLAGMGRGVLVVAQLDGPGIASHHLRILTRAGKPIEVWESKGNPEYGEPRVTATYYGADFRHAAAPSMPVVGVVRDRDTGKPLAGASVRSYKLGNHPLHGRELLAVTTDAAGRYRLDGLPQGPGNQILVLPPADQPYLPVHADVPPAVGRAAVTVDLALKRGVWIEGRVTDKATGQPVRAQVEYFALDDNPHLRDCPGFEGTLVTADVPSTTKEDGTFRVVGLPGPGVVALRAGDNYLLAPERDDAEGARTQFLSAAPYHVLAANYQALARVDPPADAATVRRDATLDPGWTVTGEVHGPDGQPLAGVRCSGLTPAWGWERPPLETAAFTVRAFNPKRPRPILFRHVEKGLVGALVAPREAGGRGTVQLEPGATAVGRLVDGDGQPRVGVELDVIIGRLDGWREGYSLPGKVRTDAAGRFTLGTLLPGYRYELTDRKGSNIISGGLRTGETKDLGDVRLKTQGE